VPHYIPLQYLGFDNFIWLFFTLAYHHAHFVTRWDTGDNASIEELESAGTSDPKWLVDRVNHLSPGRCLCMPIRYSGFRAIAIDFTDDRD
jgi:hypothetical protein